MNAVVLIVSGLSMISALGAAILAAETPDLLVAIVASAVVSLVSSLLFYLLQAPDVAITEASIGAGLTTAILIMALRKTERYDR